MRRVPGSRMSLRQRLNVSRLALSYPRLTVALWLLIGVSGVLAAWRLPIALFPDIAAPVILVTITAPGQPAETVERELTIPVEQRLFGLSNRGHITSSTAPGAAAVTVPFDIGLSPSTAEIRVRAALRGLTLPASSQIDIRRIDLDETPIVTYAITPLDRASAPASIANNIERLRSQIAAVRGVAHVATLGLDVPGQPPMRVRLNGAPAVALEVVKTAGTNTLEVARAISAIVSDTPASAGLRIDTMRAEAPFIREATGATLEALWMAVILSVLVIYAFLRRKAATAISALAIPTSLVGTFLVMALAGFKFETITLLALALVIGIIVDDAIVDVENIVRHLPGAENVNSAVRLATDEIGLTVTAATLTIVAVFVPVSFMGGVVGTFFRPFGLTISAAVLTSLLVARTLIPVLAARWLGRSREPPPSPTWRRFCHAYRRLLVWSLAHPRTVLAAATASFFGGVALVPLIPQGFIPALDRGACEVHFSLSAGTGIAVSDAVAAHLAEHIASDPDVERVLSVTGSAAGEADGGVLYVALKPARAARTQTVEARLRRALVPLGIADISVEEVPIIAIAAQKPLEIILTSHDTAALALAATRVLHQIAPWPGVEDATISGLGERGDHTWLRHEGWAAAVIRANLADGVAIGTVAARVRSELPRALPSDVLLELAGESAQASDVFAHFATALGLALLGVLAVLLALFGSWQDPIAIASSLPLAAVGGMFGLFVTRSDFGIISLLGLVFLMGLVNKNAIILVDRINQLRASGLSRSEAILEAGPIRLRPIIMTTSAAVLAMLPIAIGLGAGAELRTPMAVTIIGGLLTSTLLSLVVVPVIYQLLDSLRPRFGGGSG
jgi:multidrug efflux pump subunit AcrB